MISILWEETLPPALSLFFMCSSQKTQPCLSIHSFSHLLPLYSLGCREVGVGVHRGHVASSSQGPDLPFFVKIKHCACASTNENLCTRAWNFSMKSHRCDAIKCKICFLILKKKKKEKICAWYNQLGSQYFAGNLYGFCCLSLLFLCMWYS